MTQANEWHDWKILSLLESKYKKKQNNMMGYDILKIFFLSFEN